MEYYGVRINDGLYHHGIKGMHWGVRRYQNADGSVTSAGAQRYYGASDKFKASNGMTVAAPRNKRAAFVRGITGSRVGNAAIKGTFKINSAFDRKNRDRYKKMQNTADREFQAVREANRAHKEALTTQRKQLNKSASIGERLFYSEGTRRQAAKYIVNNNMSVEEATKKAKRKALRNTALFLAAYGAYKIHG